jgi:hypothetical protein
LPGHGQSHRKHHRKSRQHRTLYHDRMPPHRQTRIRQLSSTPEIMCH